VAFRVPVVEVAPATYHQQRGVELRLPVFRTRF
jgi:hypothetical protein